MKVKKIEIFSFIIGIFLVIGIVFLFSNSKKDFHDFHVKECEYCHEMNMTFLLCSGFCVEQRGDERDNFCAISPIEDCEKNIPHGSIV